MCLSDSLTRSRSRRPLWSAGSRLLRCGGLGWVVVARIAGEAVLGVAAALFGCVGMGDFRTLLFKKLDVELVARE